MSRFSVRLRELRREHGMSQQALAEKVGKSKSSINMYERGEREPGIELLQRLSSCLGVDIGYLTGTTNERGDGSAIRREELCEQRYMMEKFDIMPLSKRRIPLLGDIACGKPIYADEDRESYVEIGTDINADFCLRCKGDSMVNARIYDGDIVFVRKQDTVENGDIAVVVIEDEATLKRVYYYPSKQLLILRAENPRYKDFVYSQEELENIYILGKAVAFQADII